MDIIPNTALYCWEEELDTLYTGDMGRFPIRAQSGNQYVMLAYQSKTIRGTKNVSYDAQLCPVIAKGQRAPNAQLTHQIVDRHHEDLKSSSPDSQTHKNPV
jgi:hypothetical protein